MRNLFQRGHGRIENRWFQRKQCPSDPTGLLDICIHRDSGSMQCLNTVKPGRISALWRVNRHRLSLQLRLSATENLIASSRWLTQNKFDGIFVKFSSQVTLFGHLWLFVLCIYILSSIFMSLYMWVCMCVSYFCFAGLLFVCLLVFQRGGKCGV